MTKKTHKKKKSVRMRGHGAGTHGGGARKKRKGSGHHGGIGMAGTGKKSGQKITLVTKLYGHSYFGKQGVTSKGTERDKRKRINLRNIEINLEKYGKKQGDKFEIDLSKYKILGNEKVKNKLIIKAKEASKSAIKRVKEAGGEILLKPNGEL